MQLIMPKAVQEQSKAIDEYYRQKEKEKEMDTGKEEAVSNPPEDPGVKDEEDTDVQAREEASAEQEPGTGDLDGEQEVEGAQDSPSEDWQQKYRTLQGMYNAEIPRVSAENRGLRERLTQMEALLGNLSAPKPEDAPGASRGPVITEEDRTEYGEMLDVMGRVARQETIETQEKLSHLEKTVNELRNMASRVQDVQYKQQVTGEQQFWKDITEKVPDWNEINQEEGFKNWLLTPDPLTGVPRQTYLEDAQRRLDAGRAANFFTTWQQENNRLAARPAPVASKQQELAKHVSPGRSKATSEPEEPKKWTRADITKFYADGRNGKYKGREKEWARMERDLFAAMNEGRIE